MENKGSRVSVDLGHVSGVLELIVRAAGRPVVVRDFETGGVRQVEPGVVAAPDGLLPVFLAAGEAIWHEVIGGGFDLAIERDDGALTGYRVTRIGGSSLIPVMLSIMEAAAQAERPEGIVVEELASVWDQAMARIADVSRESGGAR
jgi:hypothetical protein